MSPVVWVESTPRRLLSLLFLSRVPHSLTAVVLVWCLSLPPLYAQTTPVVLGFSGTLSGTEAAYGQGLLHGARLALAKANAERVVLELKVLDDEGDPVRAAANANQLLQRGAIALMGVHGARRTLSIAKSLLQWAKLMQPKVPTRE